MIRIDNHPSLQSLYTDLMLETEGTDETSDRMITVAFNGSYSNGESIIDTFNILLDEPQPTPPTEYTYGWSPTWDEWVIDDDTIVNTYINMMASSITNQIPEEELIELTIAYDMKEANQAEDDDRKHYVIQITIEIDGKAQTNEYTIKEKSGLGGDNPGGDNPGGSNPGGSNPGGDNPGGSNPEESNPEEGGLTELAENV